MKSGLDILEEILQRLDAIEKRLKVQDQNLKRIANSAKMADLVIKAAETPLEDWARANVSAKENAVEKKQEGLRFNFESSDAAKMKGNKLGSARRGARAVPAEAPKKVSSIMCKGKMLIEQSGKMVPIPNLAVKIYNSQDKLVKETKTNRAGHWMSSLAPGQYVVSYEGEFKGQSLVPVNKNFSVPKSLPEGQSFIEVT